jgi:hypothetical protein
MLTDVSEVLNVSHRPDDTVKTSETSVNIYQMIDMIAFLLFWSPNKQNSLMKT